MKARVMIPYILCIAFLYAESPLKEPNQETQTKEAQNKAVQKQETQNKESPMKNAGAQKEDVNYLLEDSNTKFPVSDYIWQKAKPAQDINSLFKEDSKDTREIVGYDSKGNPLYKDAQGNIVDSQGNIVQTLKQQLEAEQARLNAELNKGKSNEKANPKSNTKGNNKPSKKSSNKKDNSIVIEKALLESESKNPLLSEYGDDSINEAYEKTYANLYRDSYLGSRGGIQTQEDRSNKYGDSQFSNQENIDEATNEHKLYRTITAGKLIPCILLTPINSEIEGLVSAQVEQDIYATMGRAVLIPRGSKVIGFYKNDNEIGQSRIQITWREIITPQGVNILLTNAVVGDSEGYAGAVGYLNNRYWQRYGMGIVMQTLANAITFSVANATQQPNASAGANYYTGQILAQSQNDINSVLRQIISKQSNIKAIVQIKAGSRIYITPTAHIWFPIPKNNETMARYFEE